MYPRRTTVRRGKKTYRYVHLVESHRRADGVPVQRALVNLGPLSDQAFENLQIAFSASRQGKAVVVQEETLKEVARDKVKANLRYLDVAVVHHEWERWGLGPVVSSLIGEEETTISTAKVIECLTIQRCVAPRSKLFAQQWFPTTTLPELLGIPLGHFNNTRVHRALDALARISPRLQEKLTSLYQTQEPAFAAMFLDVTDTYFEGHGCESAKRSRTKAGHRNKWCISIVLLANEKGFPLRWAMVPGRVKDHDAMGPIVGEIQNLEWAKGVPLVCDRAMGMQSSVKSLHDTGLHFLTAAHVDSIESYSTKLPWKVFSEIEIQATEASRQHDIERVVQCANEMKDLERVDEDLFVMDLGLVSWVSDTDQKQEKPTATSAPSGEPTRARGRKAGTVREGQLTGSIPEHRTGQTTNDKASANPARLDEDSPESYTLRLVAYFNPHMFVDQRRRAREHLVALQEFVADLNVELATARRSRSEESTRRKIVQRLEKNNYLDLFDVHLQPMALQEGRVASFRCELKVREDAWKRRQRYNGFVLLIGHPDLQQSAKQLALLYRAKDMVEKDFQLIKSLVKLRPIYHRTDPKVLAHVDLCMLALLQERSLEDRLATAGLKQTAALTIEQLATCHLNLMKPGTGGPYFYSVTEATREQRRVLDVLRLPHLTDDNAVAGEIRPRFVSTQLPPTRF